MPQASRSRSASSTTRRIKLDWQIVHHPTCASYMLLLYIILLQQATQAEARAQADLTDIPHFTALPKETQEDAKIAKAMWDGMTTGAKVGVILGPILGLFIIVGLLVKLRRHHRQKKAQSGRTVVVVSAGEKEYQTHYEDDPKGCLSCCCFTCSWGRR